LTGEDAIFRYSQVTYTYDQNGNLTQVVARNPNYDSFDYTMTLTYDTNNCLTNLRVHEDDEYANTYQYNFQYVQVS